MKPKQHHCYGHTPQIQKGAKTSNSGVERNVIRYTSSLGNFMVGNLTRSELSAAVRCLKINNPQDQMALEMRCRQNIGTITKELLLRFFNLILEMGRVPNAGGEVRIIPIMKKQKCKSCQANYRPISLFIYILANSLRE